MHPLEAKAADHPIRGEVLAELRIRAYVGPYRAVPLEDLRRSLIGNPDVESAQLHYHLVVLEQAGLVGRRPSGAWFLLDPE
jgi:hypothetical protein